MIKKTNKFVRSNMRKVSVLAVVIAIITAATLTSCGNSAPKPSLRSDVDSMSYALGMAQTQGLKPYLVNRMGVDTTYMDDFIQGLLDGVAAEGNDRKAAYFAGLQIGQQITNQMMPRINMDIFGNDSTEEVSMKNFMSGFVSGVSGKRGVMNYEQAGQLAQTMMQDIRRRSVEKQFSFNRIAGEKFLEENKKNDSVKVLPSGVQYKILKMGTGPVPTDSSMVEVRYEGRTLDGEVFDTTAKRKKPLKLRCNQVIKGWSEVLQIMPVGSEWEIYIPQELAYGDKQQGHIIPYSMLIFKLNLLGIE